MPRPTVALMLAASLLPGLARAETCRFAGDTSRGGHLDATVTTSETADTLTVDAAIVFTIRAFMTDYRYLGQEISTWRDGTLETVAVNQRTIADGEVKRQQWDVFVRRGPLLEASRLQGKTASDLRQHHPSFMTHWPPATFAQPWLDDFRGAGPDRRPDLDLPAQDTRPPLAFAFYWTRFLAPGGERATLVLPSRKRDKTATLAVGPATAGDGWQRWSAPVQHPALQTDQPSLAAAWVSPQRYLLQLGVELHTGWASGQAILRTGGCQGVQIRPPTAAKAR